MSAEETTESPALLTPLTDTALMVRRASAEDVAARCLRTAVADEHEGDRALFMRLAEDAAREANGFDAALVERYRYSPQGIGRDWPTEVTTSPAATS